MRIVRLCTIVLARFLISAVFLAGGISKIINWHETEKLVANILCDWQSYVGFSETAQTCFAMAVPWTPLILITGTLLELVGGLCILLGLREKLGATLLILFLIPATILMHQFWFIETGDRELQTVMFLKNLALFGGLLMVLLHGAQGKAGARAESDGMPSFKLG